MSSKRNENFDALERVRGVNADALGILSMEGYHGFTPQKSPRGPQMRGGFGNYGEIPQFVSQVGQIVP